ncbi:MAG: MerR family transcriptional regulator [Prevotella sp.]|jgi:DNA-binding transcriptional MerR regulator|nr:MerR family transcriptional regulator [Prevotella sp.]
MKKVYYTIKEVAEMFSVKESLLRFWESEFPQLKPQTVGNKVRQYTQKDIDMVGVIYNLVKVRGFKIAAARKMLNENRTGAEQSEKILNTLINVRDELTLLKNQLDRLT